MRSINVKRVAAVAAGTAMVLSSLASGLAVTVGSDVPAMLKTWKSNLDKVQIVVGTDGSYVSDAIAAARIAAELSNIAYTSTAVTVTQDDPTVTTTGSKTVTTSGGGGATASVSATQFPITYSADQVQAQGGGGTQYATQSGVNKTVTPTTLPGILSTKKISSYLNNALREVTYEEQITVNNSQVLYAKADSPTRDQGLFLKSQFGNIVYRLAFLGSGLQTSNATTVYTEVPTITVLGNDYSIDLTDLSSNLFTLYAGQKKTLESGSSYTTADGYKVDVIAVGQVTSAAGTQLAATISVTSPAGAVESATINSASGRDFFGGKVSVYIESAIIGTGGKNLAVARLGTGKKQFTAGTSFPLDSAWTVKNVATTGAGLTNYLQSVEMEYGQTTASDNVARGQFDGTVTNGVKAGIVIPGPKNAQGTSLFAISLKGFGGTSTIDTSKVTIKGVGTRASSTDVIQVTWTDPDGLVNVFDPAQSSYAAINVNNTAGALVQLTTGITPYTIVGSTVLYFDQVRVSGSGSNLQYTPYFKVGGVSGNQIYGTPVGSTGYSTLTYQTAQQSISCGVYVSTSTLNQVNITQNTTCNLVPSAVALGPSTVMDLGTPTMDLRAVTGGNISNVNNAANTFFPYVRLTEVGAAPAPSGVSVVWDSSTTGGVNVNSTDTYQGLLAYNTTLLNGSYPSNASLWLSGAGSLINQVTNAASSSSFELNAYDVDPVGTELDGSVANTLQLTVPEAWRTSLVSIAQVIQPANVTTGDQTISAGTTVGGVTIKAINCPTATATKGNATASPASAATVTRIVPKMLVVTDAAGDATSAYQIVVGGPYVNKVARAMSAATLNQVTTGAGASVVLAEGTKVLVAGYTATDTAAAADELIKQLELLRE